MSIKCILDAQVPGPHVALTIGKTGRQHRVPILPWLAPWLRAHIAMLPKGAVYLFPTSSGHAYASRTFTFGWARDNRRDHRKAAPALERAGIDRKIRFHDLRGTCATHLALGTWGRSWSLHEVQAMLAHADQKVTQRYVRRALDSLAMAAAATPGGPRRRAGERTEPRPQGPASQALPTADATARNASSFERRAGPAGRPQHARQPDRCGRTGAPPKAGPRPPCAKRREAKRRETRSASSRRRAPSVWSPSRRKAAQP